MTEDHQPSPSFPATGPTLESDDYVVYHGEDTLAIYCTRNQGVSLNDKLNFTEKTLMIYAETIFLNSKVISVEGKNLGIFCNRLVLSLDEACIDVSGTNGTDGTEPGKKAGNGGSGGTIWLYVEEPTPNLRKNLRLKAYGGDGGRGAAGKPQGGEGGDGGSCGVLKCYIGSTVLRYAERLYSVTTSQKSNWPGWIRDVNETISKDVLALVDNGFDEGTANSWESTVASTAGLLDAAEKLQNALGRLISDDPGRAPLRKETVDEMQRLLDSLGKMVKNQNGPGLPSQQDVTLLVQLADDCDSFYGGAAAEKKLQGVLKSALTTVAALTPTASRVSPLLKGLQYISAMLHSFIDEEAQGFVDQAALLGGGKGGPGGSGPTPEIPSGKRGADQPDNMADAQLVSLSSNKINRLVDQAIVSPEQCQMILNAADNLYFANDRSQLPRAMNMYTRLTRRLSFLDVLLNDKDGASAPLTKALQTLESRYQLTIAPVSQLDGIYQAARRRLNSIVLNQDLWGHSDTWVPRLSLAYYGDRTKTMIKDFKELEAIFREYSKKEQKERLTESQVNQAQLSNGTMIQAAQDNMLSISRRGGELEVAADKIALCRSLMATARKQLAISLGAFREKVQNHFSVSADTFMDALSTLSMAPEGFTAIVQAADVIHKSWTKIENDQGNLIKKDYIVKQIKACQGSFASLAKTYEDLDASELKVDDPGFAKIFATADDLKKILDEFEEQVPADDVRTKLDAYLDVVQKRNAAVINYNGLIHSYLQLQRIVQGCKEESRQLGERALQLNPSLPAIYFWLKRLRGQNRLQILRELNNQARALSFWGPMPVDSVSFPPPGPITGYTELQSYHTRLVNLFQSSYEGFQAGGWSSWPADGKFLGEGISVPLSQGVLDNLKRERGGQGLGAHDVESFLTITPKSHTDFLDMANVRLTQVRVWLLGATVGTAQVSDGDTPRRALRVEITHCGDDTLWDPDGTPCRFRHAPVTMQFSYETSVFNASGGQRSGRPGLVYSRQDIEHDYAGGSSRPGATDKPPIGPFGDWKLEIRKDVNPGLNLQSVTAGWIEFCGRNKLATSPLRGV